LPFSPNGTLLPEAITHRASGTELAPVLGSVYKVYALKDKPEVRRSCVVLASPPLPARPNKLTARPCRFPTKTGPAISGWPCGE